MPTDIKSKPGLKNAFAACSEEVRGYFEHIPKLLDDFPMQVCLAYAFFRLELGQNMALYAGAVKQHKVNVDVAWNAVGTQHMTREGFLTLYKNVYGLDLPKAAHDDLKKAEATRDRVMHGKGTSEDKIRNAIACVLQYAEEINKQLGAKYGLKPYGSLKGFTGAAKKLDKATSRLVLKGLGFAIA